MAVKLDKLYQDCSHPDPQIQTYALMTVTRLSPQLADQPDQIQRILDKLKTLMQSKNPDVVFLARKAVNHLEVQFKDYIKREAAPAAAPPMRDIGPAMEQLAGLEGMMNIDGPVAFPAGASPLIDLEELNKPEPAPPPPPPPAPEPQRPARDLSREQILTLLTTTTDPVYLASLVMALVQKGRTEDVPQVIAFLKHADDRVRANAVETVQAHGAPDHVQHLVPLLDDRSNRVVGNACMALAKFDHPLVPRKLLAMLRSNLVSMRETAAFVLTTLERDYAEPLLVLAARDPYEGVRLRAIKRLAHWVTRDSVNALKNALNDIDIDVCEAASESLRHIKATLQTRKAAEATAQAAATQAAAAQAGAQAAQVAQAAAAPRPPQPAPPVAQPIAQAVAPAEPKPAPKPEAVPAPRQIATPKPAPSPVAAPPAHAAPPVPHAHSHAAQPESVLAPEPSLTASAAALHPEEATPVVPAAAPAPRSHEGDLLSNAHRELGEVVYTLCRNNYITNELLDGLFYEILRYQDFLRAYQSKQSKLEDASQKAAIEKLEEKIRTAMIGLGRQAASLFNNAQVPIPEKERPQIQGILERVKKARRATTGH